MKAPRPAIILIPWDPDSPAHIERMLSQRIACRWHSEMVEPWRDLQRSGAKSIQWVVLKQDDPRSAGPLAEHIAAYPSERDPISDTARLFGGKERQPNPDLTFVPVGHISLDPKGDDPLSCDTYTICSFYISFAIQGIGLGGASMDAIEKMAAGEPLNAKTLLLSTTTNDTNEANHPRWKALGRDPPQLSTEDMYARRGYEKYGYIEDCWDDYDTNGKNWPKKAVLMRKDVR